MTPKLIRFKGAAANLFSALSLFREYYENRMSELKDEAAAKAWYEKVRSAMKGQG